MGKLIEALLHPDEVLPLVRMYICAKQITKLPNEPNLAFCYSILNDVSRSFAIVIQELPQPLKDAICVFYLVLRGLDTVEDDMAIPDDIKLPELLAFHTRLYNRSYNMNCGYKAYVRLMAEFYRVNAVFLSLDKRFQDVIADITKRMGAGMAKYIQTEVKTLAEYDEYCHYVAGLVGIGLSQLFATAKLEDPSIAKVEDLANHMGLMLQKTNIIRDYLEDICEEPAPRMFWPEEVWGLHAPRLDSFKDPKNRTGALATLNTLVHDALRHFPHCLEYMSRLRHPAVFRFCSIPQVMAICTLALCYDNGTVFEGVVKMRRGETALIFDSLKDMGDLLQWFDRSMSVLAAKVDRQAGTQPPSAEVARTVAEARSLCKQYLEQWRVEHPAPPLQALGPQLGGLVAAATYFYYAWRLGDSTPGYLDQYIGQYRAVLEWQPELQRVLASLLLILALFMVIFGKK